MEKDPYGGENQPPHGLYLHLYGIIATIAGMPVRSRFAEWIKH